MAVASLFLSRTVLRCALTALPMLQAPNSATTIVRLDSRASTDTVREQTGAQSAEYDWPRSVAPYSTGPSLHPFPKAPTIPVPFPAPLRDPASPMLGACMLAVLPPEHIHECEVKVVEKTCPSLNVILLCALSAQICS